MRDGGGEGEDAHLVRVALVDHDMGTLVILASYGRRVAAQSYT
jgi:hypothetical protein